MNRPILVLGAPLLLLIALSATAQHGSSPHWAYEGKEGPSHWSNLDSAFKTCGIGTYPLPIDVRGAIAADLPSIEFHYQPSPLEIADNGHTVQVTDGLIADADGFVLAPFGTNQLFRVDRAGHRRLIAILPGGRLDGLYPLGDGDWAVTSWDTKSVFRVDSTGTVTVMAEDIDSPAQLGIDRQRGLMVIPSFNGDALEIRPVRQ